MYKIGIIENSFVGSAVSNGFSPNTGYNNASIKSMIKTTKIFK